MKVCYFLINSIFLIQIFLDELTIELPNNIWEVTVELHKKLLTEIPKAGRSYWSEKVDKFYLIY
jgi:hypothetical protein